MIQKVKLKTRSGKMVTGCRITVTTQLHSDIGKIWSKIQDIATLREICRPKASFISCGGAPIRWSEGASFVFKLFLHRFLPVGRHTIHVLRMDEAAHEIETEEYNKTVAVWNHRIRMEEAGGHVTKYTDTVDLYAGCLTPAAAWWTSRFYRHRQRKWREIVEKL